MVARESLTLLHRVLNKSYKPQELTIGVSADVYEKTVSDTRLNLVVFDLGGQLQFQFLHHQYAKGANAVIFLFDLTRPQSFFHLQFWLDLLQPKEGVLRVLVGAKQDLLQTNTPSVENTLIEDFCCENKMAAYFPCSSLTGDNCEAIFDFIVQEVCNTTIMPSVPLEMREQSSPCVIEN